MQVLTQLQTVSLYVIVSTQIETDTVHFYVCALHLGIWTLRP